jgi:hypothetical protein
MSTGELVDFALSLDSDGEVRAGEDNLMILQMEITDRIRASQKE